MTRPRRRLAAAFVALAGVTAACTAGDDSAAPSTVATTTTSVPPTAVTDGQLTIGVLLPASTTLLTEPIERGVDVAVARINAAGGVLGRPVRLITRDEGDSQTTGRAAMRELLDEDVDAIIGPSSSLVALGTLDLAVAAGVVACSPTASAMALDNFPDNGLFFRTVPSDSLQAVAIAQAAAETGARRATIIHVDDVYGRPFADAVAARLGTGAITEVMTFPVPASPDDVGAIAEQIDTSEPQVLIVLANADLGSRILTALDRTDTSTIASVVVNDALRDVTTASRVRQLDPALREKIVGLSPHAEAQPPAEQPYDPSGPFAANAFDCVNLIALAAFRADTDAPRSIATGLAVNTVSGSACRSFAECIEKFEDGLQIDYTGPAGAIDLQRGGDPSRAVFDRFGFAENGQSVLQRLVTVTG